MHKTQTWPFLTLANLKHAFIACGLFFSSLLLYSLNISHGLYVDELYHLLPAQSVLNDGTLTVASGEYTRAEAYTRFIAAVFDLFGESVEVARYTSSLFVSGCVVLVYFAFLNLIGKKEALVAALVLAILPSSIYIAQFVRFYALHQLLFFSAAMGAYTLVVLKMTVFRKAIIAFLTIGAFGIAYHFQLTTLIGVFAILCWFTLYLVDQAINPLTRSKWTIGLLFSLLILGIICLAVLGLTGKIQELVDSYSYAPPWNEANKDNLLFYHRHLRYQFPVFWLLFPLACLVAVYKNPRPAIFFATVFLVGIFILSFGGMKHERYIVFLYPFALGVWAIAFMPMLKGTYRLISGSLEGIPHWLPYRKARVAVSQTLLAAITMFAVLSNHAFPTAFHMLAGKAYYHEIGDWSLSENVVRPLLEKSEVVVTTNDVETLFYFGSYDFNFSENNFGETEHGTGQENAGQYIVDRRTGLPVISKVSALEQILKCYKSGLFLGDTGKWYKSKEGVGPKGVELLERYATRVETNPESRLVVYAWQNEANVWTGKRCAKPYQFSSGS